MPVLVVRDVRLGRLLLARLPENLQEAVGDVLSADDGGVAVARRRPRQFTFVFPLHGLSADPGGPFAAGARMRRQMRSMVENAELREAGLYFAYSQDPELNGWISIGGGQISYVADQGGVQTGSFQLELDSAFKRGAQRTHRDARRVEHWDLRLSTVERDYRGVIFGTDFSGLPVLQLTFLPVGVGDPLGPYRTPVSLNPRAGIDGVGLIAQGLSHASVVSFEQAEVDQRKGDVVIWNRWGFTAPAYGQAGDTNPQDPAVGYGWEEVYGPDHPLTAGDLPVIANGLCRVRYVPATNALAVDAFVAGQGYVEQGRLTIWDSTVQDVYTQHTVPVSQGGPAGTVMEWTPERAVIRLTSQRTAGDQTARTDTYVSLQRGWLGPRVECYCVAPGFPQAGCQVRWTPNTTGNVLRSPPIYNSPAISSSDDPLFGWADPTGTAMRTIGEPWTFVQPVLPTLLGAALVSIQAAARLPASIDSAAYGGTARYGVAIAARYGEAQNQVPTGYGAIYGYASLRLGFPATGTDVVADAKNHQQAGTTATTVPDAGAISGSAVNDTQTAGTFYSVILPFRVPPGKYAVWVRARVTTAGDTLSVFATVEGTNSPIPTTTSATYVWLALGEIATAMGAAPAITVWRSGGTGTTGVNVDRVVLTATERRQPAALAYDGARDLAASSLLDSRAIPHLQAR